MFALWIGGCIFEEIGLKIRFPITRPHICEAFFLWFLDKVSLKLLFDKKSYSLTTLIMNNKNEFILLNNQPDLGFLNINLLKFSINLQKTFYGFNQ